MNTTPIDTQTLTRRIPLTPAINLEQAIKQLCDNMGAGGYQLCGTFVADTDLILVFELTR